MELDKIPGLKETVAAAQAREEELRDVAMLGFPMEIAGVPVRQLSLRHLILLFLARSPFVCGGDATPEAILHFLWIVSPRFSYEAARRTEFILEVRELVKCDPAAEAIEEYLEAALIDRPAGSGGAKSAPIVSFAAAIVHEVAAAYGWTKDVILDEPLAGIYQALRLIIRDDYMDKGKRPPPTFNALSDRARREAVDKWLKEKRERESKSKSRSKSTKKPRARRDGEGSHE